MARSSSRLPQGFFDRPIAHRGLHGLAPGVIENSRAACMGAVEAGYAIEIDVQMSADGEAIVFHDDRLDRLTSAAGAVRERSASALATLTLTGSTEAPPRLGEVLALVDGQVPLVVEIKDQSGDFGPAVGPLEERVGALLSGYGGPAAAMSFNPYSVAAFAKAAPSVPIGLVADAFADAPVALDRRRALSSLADAEALDVDFVSYGWRDLPAPAVEAFRREGRSMGRPVVTWTIRSAAEAETALAHSDQITFEGYRP